MCTPCGHGSMSCDPAQTPAVRERGFIGTGAKDGTEPPMCSLCIPEECVVAGPVWLLCKAKRRGNEGDAISIEFSVAVANDAKLALDVNVAMSSWAV